MKENVWMWIELIWLRIVSSFWLFHKSGRFMKCLEATSCKI